MPMRDKFEILTHLYSARCWGGKCEVLWTLLL